MKKIKLYNGDCLEVMRKLEDNSVDSVVTDPPYGLSFMGKKWDHDVPSVEIWAEALRVLKPGGHLLAFAGTRTQHRMAVRIEDAGFEIRDVIMWVYGSGFPKSHNISKAIDKAGGVTHPKGELINNNSMSGGNYTRPEKQEVKTKQAKQWDGWGTALKPAVEPITVARKPFKGTVAGNVLEHGCGGINIDGCRVENTLEDKYDLEKRKYSKCVNVNNIVHLTNHNYTSKHGVQDLGRFPANFIHCGCDEVICNLPDQAHKFFYIPKTSKSDRNEGLESLERERQGLAGEKKNTFSQNNHPTVKPTELMQYLVRLVTPPKGRVLDPFMGSGSTGKACVKEGFKFIGIEMDKDYLKIAKKRIKHAK